MPIEIRRSIPQKERRIVHLPESYIAVAAEEPTNGVSCMVVIYREPTPLPSLHGSFWSETNRAHTALFRKNLVVSCFGDTEARKKMSERIAGAMLGLTNTGWLPNPNPRSTTVQNVADGTRTHPETSRYLTIPKTLGREIANIITDAHQANVTWGVIA